MESAMRRSFGPARQLCGILLLAALALGAGPAAARDWTLTADRAGGIAGVNQRLTLSSTGRGTLEDRGGKTSRAFTLPAADLQAIDRLIPDTVTESIDDADVQPQCCDRYELHLSLTLGGATHQVAFDQSGQDQPVTVLGVAATRDLFDRLVPLLDGALPPQ
jgi:hypothetical protein